MEQVEGVESISQKAVDSNDMSASMKLGIKEQAAIFMPSTISFHIIIHSVVVERYGLERCCRKCSENQRALTSLERAQLVLAHRQR